MGQKSVGFEVSIFENERLLKTKSLKTSKQIKNRLINIFDLSEGLNIFRKKVLIVAPCQK
jgi:hypothetical protein